MRHKNEIQKTNTNSEARVSIDGGGKRQGAVLRCQFSAPPHSFTLPTALLFHYACTALHYTIYCTASLFHSARCTGILLFHSSLHRLTLSLYLLHCSSRFHSAHCIASLFHSALHCATLQCTASLFHLANAFFTSLHSFTMHTVLLSDYLTLSFLWLSILSTISRHNSAVICTPLQCLVLFHTALQIAFCLVLLQAEPRQGHRLFSTVFCLFFSAHNLYICTD